MGTLTIASPIAALRVQAIRKQWHLDESPPPPKPSSVALRVYEQARQVHAAASKMYPQVFGRGEPKPLARGVHQELEQALAGKFHQGEVDAFLRSWTSRARYLAVVAEGKPRVALDGTEVEVPTEAHRKTAADRLAEKMKRPTDKVRRFVNSDSSQGKRCSTGRVEVQGDKVLQQDKRKPI